MADISILKYKKKKYRNSDDKLLQSKTGMGLFHEQSFTILLYFFSVLIAHNGFVYDFPLLLAEVDRRYPLLKNDLFKHICFGDSLVNLRTVRLRAFNFNAKKDMHKMYQKCMDFGSNTVYMYCFIYSYFCNNGITQHLQHCINLVAKV